MAVPFLYTRVDEEIRRRVEEKLQAHYVNLTVHVRFAKLVEGEGIEVREVSILDPRLSGPQAELAYIDEIFIACGTELGQLASGLPPSNTSICDARASTWRARAMVRGAAVNSGRRPS